MVFSALEVQAESLMLVSHVLHPPESGSAAPAPQHTPAMEQPDCEPARQPPVVGSQVQQLGQFRQRSEPTLEANVDGGHAKIAPETAGPAQRCPFGHGSHCSAGSGRSGSSLIGTQL